MAERSWWTWRRILTLLWVALTSALAWTWAYAWRPFVALAVWVWFFVWIPIKLELFRLLTSFLDWFPPPWLTATWRVGITVAALIMSGLLAWAWSGSRARPVWTTWAGWQQVGIFPFRKGYGLFRYWWHPPDLDRMVEIGEDENLMAAYRWADEFAPTRNGVVYEAVLKHAENSYKEVTEVSANLDRKADDLMKISGAVGAALAAAGRIAGITSALTSRPVLLAVGCLVATMLICARARKPVKKIVPMTVKAAMEVAEKSGLPYIPDEEEDVEDDAGPDSADRETTAVAWSPTPPDVLPSTAQMKATIAASYHWAIAGTQYVIDWKARLITAATLVFCIGLILLVVGFQGPLW
jgi:hypothetical protein